METIATKITTLEPTRFPKRKQVVALASSPGNAFSVSERKRF
jgi:hypothetical protein